MDGIEKARSILLEITERCSEPTTYSDYQETRLFYMQKMNIFVDILSSLPRNDEFYSFCGEQSEKVCHVSFLGEGRGVLTFISHILQDLMWFSDILHIELYEENEHVHVNNLKEMDNIQSSRVDRLKANDDVKKNRGFEIRLERGTPTPADRDYIPAVDAMNVSKYLNIRKIIGKGFESFNDKSFKALKSSRDDYSNLREVVISRMEFFGKRGLKEPLDKSRELIPRLIRVRELDNDCKERSRDRLRETPEETVERDREYQKHMRFTTSLQRICNNIPTVTNRTIKRINIPRVFV